MAKAKTPSSDDEIVELQIFINPRGRSVVNGTLRAGGEIRTIKHELTDRQKSDIGEFILRALS
jgi:hypothetical protein